MVLRASTLRNQQRTSSHYPINDRNLNRLTSLQFCSSPNATGLDMSANADLPYLPPSQLRPGYGRTVGATAAVASVATMTLVITDASVVVSVNILVTF